LDLWLLETSFEVCGKRWRVLDYDLLEETLVELSSLLVSVCITMGKLANDAL